MSDPRHWESVYREKREDAVSWFQVHPELSLEFIQGQAAPADAIIDVGGGASRLVDHLLAAGYTDLTVLDISVAALEQAGRRLGAAARRVHWQVADVISWQPARRYRFWHDRAAFHFLVEPVERQAYIDNLRRALAGGGHALIATFAADGPERCSGLPVRRYSPESLAMELGPAFKLREQRHETHLTPAARLQRFQYSLFEHAGS